jgi:hypothetical protein
MITIYATNLNLDKAETTHLSRAHKEGQTLYVRFSQGFSANDYIVIGDYCGEKAEIAKISSVGGSDTLALSTTLKNQHPVDTTIKIIPYNQIEFGYSTNGTAWNVLDTVDIQSDDKATPYNHSSGLSSYYYRYRFYNSTTTLYSSYSSTVLGSGFSRQALFSLREAVREELGQANEDFITDSMIDRWLNDAQDEIKRYYPKWRFLSAKSTTSSTAGEGTLSLPARYDHSLSIDYNYVDSDTDIDIVYPLRQISKLEMDNKRSDNNAEDSDEIEFFYVDEADSLIYFEFNNETADCSFELEYFQKFPTLSDDSDETLVPDPAILVEYATEMGKAKINNSKPDFSEFRRKRFDLLKHEKPRVGATGLRQPIEGLGKYYKGLR